jgi:hypothetical protein
MNPLRKTDGRCEQRQDYKKSQTHPQSPYPLEMDWFKEKARCNVERHFDLRSHKFIRTARSEASCDFGCILNTDKILSKPLIPVK